ncbi:hypothetical protein SAMN05442782_10864 [Streptomyces sp. OK228]|nr:hypothetical protein SAMN05442782_10864 [Streptomyces sp. OK228]
MLTMHSELQSRAVQLPWPWFSCRRFALVDQAPDAGTANRLA